MDAFPELGARRGFRSGATAKLTFPVDHPPPILVAGVKPKILGTAAAIAASWAAAESHWRFLRAKYLLY